MKKISILFILFFCFMISQTFAQYRKWALDFELGTHRVIDESALTVNNPLHLGLGFRYNINPKVGLGLSLGHDFGKMDDFNHNRFNFRYTRLHMQGYVNVFQVLDLQNKVFTLLLHGGPGISRINTNNNGHNENLFSIYGGITGLVKLTPSLALKMDYSTVSHLKQERTLDGAFQSTNTGVNSVINTYSIGLVWYFGGKKSKTPHADWYVVPPYKCPEPVINNINNYYKKDSIIIERPCNCIAPEYPFRGYIFFDHDKWDIKESMLNQFYDMAMRLRDNPGHVLVIRAWASPTISSNEYNMELAKKRCIAIRDKYIAMGIDPKLLKFEWHGKDFTLQTETVHDLARRVEIYLEKQK